MADTARLEELKKRLAALRKHMLPRQFPPTGNYSELQLDRARGYRLLAHAEIEAFIEDITFDAAKKGVSEWTHTKKVSDCLFCLVAHYHQGFAVEGFDEQPPLPSTSRPKIKDAIKEAVQVAIQQYRSIHENNHGIREENLYRLVLPIGVRKDELDQLWITNLNEFGKRRGELAHKSVKAQQQIDPKSELQDVENLIIGLEQLDVLVAVLA